MFKLKLIYLSPLLVTLVYLLGTLCVFQFGPVEYNIKNPNLFWVLMFLYHLSLLAGYIVGCSFGINTKSFSSIININSRGSLKWFYIILIMAIINILIVYSGGILSFNYDHLFDLNSIFQNQGTLYTNKMQDYLANNNPNKLLNFFLFFISLSQYLIIPFTIFNFSQIKIKTKIFSILISSAPLLFSLTSGQNKGLFDFILLYITSAIIYILYAKHNSIKSQFINIKFFLILAISAFIVFLFYFGNIMSQRGGDITYIESRSGINDIKVDANSINLSNINFLYYTYSWLTTYMVQGYYGFSLALEQPFDSTYGFGSSIFITRNIDAIFGSDFQSITFQRKIDPYWSETAQWHSMYSYLANDFNFPGVAFFLFILFFLFARIWICFLNTGNIFAGSLICLYSVMIFFIPANNQVFGFLFSFSAFFWSFVLWLLSCKKNRL